MTNSTAPVGDAWDRPPGGSVLLVADLRSPHARAWVPYLRTRFGRVHVLSSAQEVTAHATTQRTDPISAAASAVAPLFRGLASDTVRGGMGHRAGVQMRHVLGYARARLLARRIRHILRTTPVTHVHALRVPWEGVAVAISEAAVPWTMSLWGSDLTTQAPQSHLLRSLTTEALRRADGLTADCRWDIAIARRLGFAGPSTVVPGGLGLPQIGPRRRVSSEDRPQRVVCPRGLLPHVRWRELIVAAGLLRDEGRAVELTFIDVRGHRPRTPPAGVRFLPRLSQDAMLALAQQTDIVASPCTSDGIPNSVLEFTSQGCIPIMGDLPSSREVVEDGVNGFLCDPLRPASIADALRRAVDVGTRQRMIDLNRDLLQQGYSRATVYSRLDEFFARVRDEHR